MNTVTFPGLGLTLHLNRVAFSIGDFHVYWYGIIIAFGFFLGVSFCCANAKKFGMKPDDILDLILFVAPITWAVAHHKKSPSRQCWTCAYLAYF